MISFSYTTWGMAQLPIDTSLEHIAATGYDGVEITVHKGWSTELEGLTPAIRRHIRARVTELGLALPAVTCPGTLVSADPADAATSVARVKRAIDLAVEWANPDGSVPVVVTIPGGKPPDWEVPALRAMLIANTIELAEYAARAGTIFAFEPHVLQIVESPDQMLEVIRQVNHPAFKVNFDISHFDVIGIPTEESVQKLVAGGLSVHTHLKDQRGRSPDHQFLIPGEGDFDYVRYLKAMVAAGYTGHIVPEISVMVQRRPGFDALAACTQSYQIVDAAFKAAGIPRPASIARRA